METVHGPGHGHNFGHGSVLISAPYWGVSQRPRFPRPSQIGCRGTADRYAFHPAPFSIRSGNEEDSTGKSTFSPISSVQPYDMHFLISDNRLVRSFPPWITPVSAMDCSGSTSMQIATQHSTMANCNFSSAKLFPKDRAPYREGNSRTGYGWTGNRLA